MADRLVNSVIVPKTCYISFLPTSDFFQLESYLTLLFPDTSNIKENFIAIKCALNRFGLQHEEFTKIILTPGQLKNVREAIAKVTRELVGSTHEKILEGIESEVCKASSSCSWRNNPFLWGVVECLATSSADATSS
ncbi:hypothetical protein RF11_11072 [Thelohanellus kitauei]|uniref:Uncharacterized protein n=1 Tax=Thelohanellus kitauei TaxID=669202 RepID=A0A0C2JJ62_THEKT|nr:hypothetical protein RF11_11072 [Thelohanellus kitauei]